MDNANAKKKERYIEWGISFWLGVSLISIINVWKIDYSQHAFSYSWMMFGISVVFLIISTIYLIKIKGEK